jgi:hypothetical protein
MPIHRVLSNAAFDPEAVKALTTAYEDVCATLHLPDCKDPRKEAVAKKIIEYAQRGERDPIRLRDSVVQDFRPR